MSNRNIGIFDKNVAAMLDINCAVVYSMLMACEGDYHDGRQWTHGSVREWSELALVLNENQTRRALKLLEKAGLIITGNYNENPFDKTKWYSTNPVPEREE